MLQTEGLRATSFGDYAFKGRRPGQPQGFPRNIGSEPADAADRIRSSANALQFPPL
jgi:hypothetical protein